MTDSDLKYWSKFNEWHSLFDEICNKSGDYDNARLGSLYCRKLGKRGEIDFETSMKNIRNWRTGKHLPRQRNFMLITQLLDVANDSELLDHWNTLYAKARAIEAQKQAMQGEIDRVASGENLLSKHSATRWSYTFGWRNSIIGLALFVAGFLCAELVRIEPWKYILPNEILPLIAIRPHVSLMVGESQIIHGERGDCGKPPPDWEYVLTRLPISRIGSFNDGGIVRRNSNFCKGETPARAVVFTAEKAGVEEVLVLGDVMRINVTDGSEQALR